jgi:hypothetical protein
MLEKLTQFSHRLKSQPFDLNRMTGIVLGDYMIKLIRTVQSVISGSDLKQCENCVLFYSTKPESLVVCLFIGVLPWALIINKFSLFRYIGYIIKVRYINYSMNLKSGILFIIKIGGSIIKPAILISHVFLEFICSCLILN